jgi:hypothetical protein
MGRSRLSLRVVCLASTVALLVGCTAPHDRIVPTDVEKWSDGPFGESLKSLPEEDKKLLLAYAMRVSMGKAFGGAGIPPGKTVGEVLAEQRAWEAEQERLAKEKAVESERIAKEQAALAAKLASERAAALKELTEALTVAVTQLKFVDGEYQDYIRVVIGFHNKTEKAMAGAKGALHFKDMFGETIKRVSLSYDEGIPAGGTKTWTGTLEYNRFNASDKKLANTDLARLTTEWEPAIYVFDDGTRMEMPQAARD